MCITNISRSLHLQHALSLLHIQGKNMPLLRSSLPVDDSLMMEIARSTIAGQSSPSSHVLRDDLYAFPLAIRCFPDDYRIQTRTTTTTTVARSFVRSWSIRMSHVVRPFVPSPLLRSAVKKQASEREREIEKKLFTLTSFSPLPVCITNHHCQCLFTGKPT